MHDSTSSTTLPIEWQAIQTLVEQSAYPRERFTLLQRQLDAKPAQPEGWLTLLAGQPAVIDLFISRWLSPDLVDGLSSAGAQPLVLGRRPESIRTGAGNWAKLKARQPAEGHLIVVRSAGAVSPTVRAQLATLGILDQMVVVTRLGQPLPTPECQLVRSLLGHAAAMHVLVVGVPGEELSESDAADLLAYGKARIQSNGYAYRQYTGLSIWYVSGAKTPATIADPAEVMAPPADVTVEDLSVKRTLAERQALRLFLDDLCRHINTTAPKPVTVQLNGDEQARLHSELSTYLARLARALERDLSAHPGWRADDLRASAWGRLQSWAQQASVENMWVRYLERVRPGAWPALLQTAHDSLLHLEIHTTERTETQPATAAAASWQAQLMLETKRAGVGLALGIGAYLVASVLFATTPLIRETIAPPIAALLSVLILLVTLALGYGLGRVVIRPATPGAQITVKKETTLVGWPLMAERLLTTLTGHLRSAQISLRDECQRLSAQYQIEEN